MILNFLEDIISSKGKLNKEYYLYLKNNIVGKINLNIQLVEKQAPTDISNKTDFNKDVLSSYDNIYVGKNFFHGLFDYSYEITEYNRISNENYSWIYTLKYPKNLLFFLNDSIKIFYYNFEIENFTQLHMNINFLKYHTFPQGLRGIELPDKSYFLTGGDRAGKAYNEVFHFAGGDFIEKQKMYNSRKHHASVYYRGYVYVFGGFGKDNKPISDCEAFNMVKGTWINLASMNSKKAYSTPLCYINRYIFLIGGLSDVSFNKYNYEVNTIEQYDIVSNKFIELKITLPYYCYSPGATFISDYKMIIIGGNTEKKGCYNGIYTIDMINGKIENIGVSNDIWTVLPLYYSKGRIYLFNSGENKEKLPQMYSFELDKL